MKDIIKKNLKQSIKRRIEYYFWYNPKGIFEIRFYLPLLERMLKFILKRLYFVSGCGYNDYKEYVLHTTDKILKKIYEKRSDK